MLVRWPHIQPRILEARLRRTVKFTFEALLDTCAWILHPLALDPEGWPPLRRKIQPPKKLTMRREKNSCSTSAHRAIGVRVASPDLRSYTVADCCRMLSIHGSRRRRRGTFRTLRTGPRRAPPSCWHLCIRRRRDRSGRERLTVSVRARMRSPGWISDSPRFFDSRRRAALSSTGKSKIRNQLHFAEASVVDY